MPSNVDYYALLSRAVGNLDRDSYAARGAVYDREHKSLMRQLFSANPPHSDAEIDRAQWAFREAVRRIEFGDENQQIGVVQEREISELPRGGYQEERDVSPRGRDISLAGRGTTQNALEIVVPAAPSPSTRDFNQERPAGLQRRPLRGPPRWSQRQPAQPVSSAQIESALEVALNLPSDAQVAREEPEGVDPSVLKRQHKPVTGRVLLRALFAVALLAIGTAGYDFLTGDVDLPWLKKITGGTANVALPSNAEPQRVILFDGSRPDLNGAKFEGKAFWRLRQEAAGRDASPAIQLDLEVPGRKVVLTMSMNREPAGSSMSHLVEMRFLGADRQPDPDIMNIAGIVMTAADMSRPAVLVGQVVNVTPGVFMFGLSGNANEREQNLRKMAEFPWIGIPLTYRNGSAGVLTFEKGADGERVISEALRRWGGR